MGIPDFRSLLLVFFSFFFQNPHLTRSPFPLWTVNILTRKPRHASSFPWNAPISKMTSKPKTMKIINEHLLELDEIRSLASTTSKMTS